MIIAAFFLSTFYWLYLIVSSQMIIVHDALVFQDLGNLIHNQGWLAYFKTGPNREPLYPLLISLSLDLEKTIGLSWLSIQKVIQTLLLLSTQILFLLAASRLKLSRLVTALLILYIGFSPALVNSSFSLFSEIASLPWGILIVLLSAYIWKNMETSNLSRLILLSATLAVCFIGINFVKAIFEVVVIGYMLMFVLRIVWAWKHSRRKLLKSALIFILVFGVIYEGVICSFKLANKFYNGQYILTNRGAWTLYGNAKWRVSQIPMSKLMVYPLTIPGEEFCTSLIGQPKCLYWTTQTGDKVWEERLETLYQQGLSAEQTKQQMFKEAIVQIGKNPLSYFFFMFMESSKVFFWESTHIGFVFYPYWLDDILNSVYVSDLLPLIIGILLILAVIFVVTKNMESLKEIFKENHWEEGGLIIFFSLWFILNTLIPLSTCSILKRYLLPLAPLSLLILGYFINYFYANKIKLWKK